MVVSNSIPYAPYGGCHTAVIQTACGFPQFFQGHPASAPCYIQYNIPAGIAGAMDELSPFFYFDRFHGNNHGVKTWAIRKFPPVPDSLVGGPRSGPPVPTWGQVLTYVTFDSDESVIVWSFPPTTLENAGIQRLR